MTATTPLSVITVTYRSDEYLKTLVISLSEATVEDILLVVVDNGPVPAVIPAPPRPGIDIVVERSGENLGYGAGMNAGRKRLGDRISDWMLLVNPDVVLEPGSLDGMIAAGAAEARIGCVGPRILTPDGLVYPSARLIPSLRIGLGHALLGVSWKGNPWTRRYVAASALPPRDRDAGWLSGACLLIRTEAFDAVRGFDEGYFMYFEDVDLGERLRGAGWSSVYRPGVTVVHRGGASTDTASRAMIREHHRSAYRFLARRYPAWYLAPLRVTLWAALRLRSRLVRQ